MHILKDKLQNCEKKNFPKCNVKKIYNYMYLNVLDVMYFKDDRNRIKFLLEILLIQRIMWKIAKKKKLSKIQREKKIFIYLIVLDVMYGIK